MVTKTYTSVVRLTEDTWKYTSKQQKKALLKALGYDESFAQTKTIRELVRRGGGMVARDLKRVSSEQLKRHGGKITVTW